MQVAMGYVLVKLMMVSIWWILSFECLFLVSVNWAFMQKSVNFMQNACHTFCHIFRFLSHFWGFLSHFCVEKSQNRVENLLKSGFALLKTLLKTCWKLWFWGFVIRSVGLKLGWIWYRVVVTLWSYFGHFLGSFWVKIKKIWKNAVFVTKSVTKSVTNSFSVKPQVNAEKWAILRNFVTLLKIKNVTKKLRIYMQFF